jgi:poly-gamma-glutamate synthesis protein (capsule biosynthesis protein)
MTPTRMKRFRINLASQDEALWLKNRLNREGRMLGTMVNLNRVGELLLEWR